MQSNPSDAGATDYPASDHQTVTKKATKRKIFLPWWCVFLGYFLCLASVICGVLVTTSIAIEFGPERSTAWLISFITSFFESLLLTQPVKVIFS